MARKKKGVKGFKIGRNYCNVTIWTFGSMIRSLHSTQVIRPNKSLTRYEKYTEIAKVLTEVFGFAPSYRPTVKEAKNSFNMNIVKSLKKKPKPVRRKA